MVEEKATLILEPKSELHFRGPTTEILTCHLKLTNPTDRRICFKVKTTAPKRYCVRPNNGVIDPNKMTVISVMLQPFDAESSNEKSKHKFMVQTAFAPIDASANFDLDSFWKTTPASAISDAKLRVVFEQGSVNSSSNLENVSNVSNLSGSGHAESLTNSTGIASLQVTGNKGDTSPLPPPSSQFSSSVSSSAAMDTSVSSNTSNSPHQQQQQQQQQQQSRTQQTSSHSSDSGDELIRLRHEVKKLRQENMQLREDGLRQRYRGGQPSDSSSSDLLHAQAKLSGRGDVSTNIQPQDLAALLVNPNVIALVVVAFVIGMVISKIVF